MGVEVREGGGEEDAAEMVSLVMGLLGFGGLSLRVEVEPLKGGFWRERRVGDGEERVRMEAAIDF